MSEPRTHVERIRKDFQASQRVKDSLNNSIQALAHDLYSKETHFIFELIQNAEDNTYEAEVEPSLSFRLVRSDPTNTQNAVGALIIQNNEIGFSPADVDAICAVGKTTKRKIQGYIGEKGIGFKSVFRITTMPHIFSGGYQFCIPEEDRETGLGYIVPRWVKEIPEGIDPTQTSIILPLDKPDIGYEQIEKMLKEIEPETILFLSKLKEIVVESGPENNLTILKDDSKTPLVQILVEGKREGESVSRVDEFLLYSQPFDRPPDIKPEKRKDIDERDVAIAFPLNDDNESAGKVFAYLPIRSDTGLPFLINADFLLTSSREGILEDEPWNKWLRDCAPAVFVTAFEKWIDIETYRARIFSFIPLEAHYSFLEPIVESIQDRLKSQSIIPTEPDGQRRKPEQTRRAYKNFRTLLQERTYPVALLETRLVLSEIEKYQEQLKAIGVKPLPLNLVKKCFQDRDWIAQHDYAWLLKSYQYLSSQNFTSISLTDCLIVPVVIEGKLQWSCDEEQPIYFECDEESKQILKHAPERVRVPLAFLDTSFFEQIKDDTKIREWMTNTLRVYDFSDRNYAVDVLTWFEKNYKEIGDSDLVATTVFLSQFTDTDLNFKDIPVLLADGRRMLLSEAKFLPGIQAVVTPEALDPETGWQNIFVTEEDRKHFVWFSDAYIASSNSPKARDNLKRLWHKMGITAPSPLKFEGARWNSELNSYEEKCCRDTDYSTQGYTITNYRPFSILSSFSERSEEDKRVLAKSLINWLGYQKEKYFPWQQAKVSYFYYSSKHKYFESELLLSLKQSPWLPTTKGFVRPSQAFLPCQDIKEILGDSVPYFKEELPQRIIELLGIRTEATAEALVSVLEQHSQNGNGSKGFAERVYRTLNSRYPLSGNILTRLRQNKLIFVPSDSEGRWVACSDAIWKDRSDVLGDDFVYLEKVYPKLKDFFVDSLQVKEDVDTEIFARRWLKLQSESGKDSRDIESILTTIYREILPICKIAEERPSWWDDFMNEALIWTQSKTFAYPQSVYVPDDGDLKAIFQDADIFFAWRPEKDSFADWEILYRAFGLPYLSESVNSSLAEYAECKVKDQPDFLTDASKVLIATWLREKRETDYQRLVKNRLLNALIYTNESRSSSLKVTHRLGETEIHRTTDSFWDRASKTLIIEDETNGRLKNSISRTLARALMSNRAYKELANWIELILGEKEWQWRIKQEGWQRVPDEVKHLIDNHEQAEPVAPSESDSIEPTIHKGDNEQAFPPDMEGSQRPRNIIPKGPDSRATHSAPTDGNNDNERPTHGRDESPQHEHPPVSFTSEKSGTKGPEQKTDPVKRNNYENEFKKSFNRPGATELTEQFTDGGKVTNPDRRRGKSYERHKASFHSEPNPEERRRETIRTILEGPSEQVREYLSQLYNGKCQICENTFPERDGNPFFIANYIVPKKLARFVDTPANAICLCADHFAKWQHGSVEAADILEQIKNFKTESEGGDGKPVLRIKLCGEEREIKFKEKHLLDLQELLRASKGQE
ncbi:MAG: hypothetical protein DRH50_10120 [Deltaproteobacteria bacterium]|nr:MAG: hypothetical protein DRH50_10120 [Deltaproteobacteria bacterium]